MEAETEREVAWQGGDEEEQSIIINNNNNSNTQRRRKRKRSSTDEMRRIVQSIVDENETVYTLQEFLEQCVPAFTKEQHEALLQPLLRESDQSKELYRCWKGLLVIPSPEFPSITKLSIGCRQDLPSLVDHVVWTLVQRREQGKLLGFSAGAAKSSHYRNLLCQGYAIQEHGSGPMTLKHLNSMVDYCQTAPIMLLLHKWLGDDLLRKMLLHTSLLVPILPNITKTANDSSLRLSNNVNYMQVTGPPLQLQARNQKRTRYRSLHGHQHQLRKSALALPPHLQPCTVVPGRRSILYADFYIPHVGLPKQHILQRMETDPSNLCRHMFHDILLEPSVGNNDDSNTNPRYWSRWQQVCCKAMMSNTATGTEKQRVSPTNQQQQVLQICQGILQRHRKCDYHRSLDKYCPIEKKTVEHRGNSKEWLAYLATNGHLPQDNVTAWMCCVLQKVFSVDCWGSTHNQSIVLQELIPKYIRLGRDETFVNKTLMRKIKITHFRWLIPLAVFGNDDGTNRKLSAADHQRLQCLVLSFLRWFISDYVTQLLRSVFYVTDSEFGGKMVLYYRRPVWALFRNLSLKKLLEQQYRTLPEADVRERLNQQQMGLSRLRLLPKATGVRPLATLCKRENVNLEGSQTRHLSTNRVLGDAFSILKYEYTRDEDRFGCGMPGLYYFYPRYREFLGKLKQRKEPGFQLYFGSADIRKCFDNIDQQHLLRVIDGVLSEDDYILQRYSVLHPSRGPLSKRQKKEVKPTEQFDPFFCSVQDLTTDHHHCVFVDSMSCAMQTKDQIMKQLKEHLTSHLIVSRGRHGNQYLVQATGIPQGSVLSNLLCNFYYGNVEKRLFSNNTSSLQKDESDSSLMVRMTDDFMFVSTEAEPVKEFVETMRRGDPELGVQINNEKTSVSSPMDLPNPDGMMERLEGNVIVGPAGSFFSWCGMLFNCHSGEVQMDYSRFFDVQANNAMTIDRAKSEGEQLLAQMKQFARPRCIPILFDSLINSQKTQILNFYQLMILVAVRTAEYLRNADLLQLPMKNISFLLEGIGSTCIYSLNLVRERTEAQLGANNLDLNRELVVQLGQSAFHDVFGYIDELRLMSVHLKANYPNIIKKHHHLHATLANLVSSYLASWQGNRK